MLKAFKDNCLTGRFTFIILEPGKGQPPALLTEDEAIEAAKRQLKQGTSGRQALIVEITEQLSAEVEVKVVTHKPVLIGRDGQARDS